MLSNGAPTPRRADPSRAITAVTLLAGGEQALFPVQPRPFVYREGMRLRIDITGGHAYVSEMP